MILVQPSLSGEDAEELASVLERNGLHPSQIDIGISSVGRQVEVECDETNVAAIAEVIANHLRHLASI